MRDHHVNLFFLAIALLVVSFGVITWTHSQNIQGEAVKGYLIQNPRPTTGNPQDLTIGVVTPLSGPYRFIGEESRHGFELARTALTSEGKTVGIVYKDSQCDPIIAERRAAELVHQGVSYVVGADCYGKDPLVIDGVSLNLNPSADPQNEYSFSFASPLEEEVAAIFDRMRPEPATLTVVYPDDAFGRDYLAAIKARSRGKIIASYAYGISQSAFGGIAGKVKGRDSEAVFIVAEDLSAVQGMMTALNDAGYHNQAFADVAVSQKYLDSLGAGKDAFEGLIFVSDIDPISSRTTATAFAGAYVAAYNEEPTTYAANAYDSAMLLARMQDQVGFERVGDRMHALLNHEGVTGFLTVNGNSVTRSYYVRQVRDGEVVEAP